MKRQKRTPTPVAEVVAEEEVAEEQITDPPPAEEDDEAAEAAAAEELASLHNGGDGEAGFLVIPDVPPLGQPNVSDVPPLGQPNDLKKRMVKKTTMTMKVGR